MSEWQKVKIGSFLKVRQGKYKPDDDAIANLKRLNKIDFSGRIHLSDKPTKTDMIIVNSGDLVISGINVEKGAIAVHQGEQPITATIHYSSYQFNDSIIDIDFLKRFLRSPAFISALKEQTKGGIKTEIKAKTLLSISVQLPLLSEQQAINRRFETFENELVQLASEINNQKTYLAKLRQAILQEAIEGQLTADWRINNPVCLGDPNTDAAALLATIKAEKQALIADGKIKKEKPLTPINPDDVPFALPDGWVWVKMNDVCGFITKGTTPPLHEIKAEGEIPFLKVYNIVNQKIDFSRSQFISESVNDKFSRSKVFSGDVLMNIVGPPLGKVALVPEDYQEWNINQAIARFRPLQKSMNKFLYLYLVSGISIKDIPTLGVVGQDNISLEQCRNMAIPLPPLAEQQAIVERVDRLLNHINALEQQVTERKHHAEQLMQAVLKEAFTN